LGSNLDRVSDITYFVERIKSLMHGANFGVYLKFGETFKLESSLGMLLPRKEEKEKEKI
jgi:hypothetical protein